MSESQHVLTIDEIELLEYLTFEDKIVKILDRKEKALRTKTVPLVNVLWQYHKVQKATWEMKERMREKYPHLFE